MAGLSSSQPLPKSGPSDGGGNGEAVQLPLSQDSPFKPPQQISADMKARSEENRRIAKAKLEAKATARAAAGGGGGAVKSMPPPVSPTKPPLPAAAGAASSPIKLTLTPEQKARADQNRLNAQAKLTSKRKLEGSLTAATTSATTNLPLIPDSNKRVKTEVAGAGAGALSRSTSNGGGGGTVGVSPTKPKQTAAAGPLPSGICVMKPAAEWLLSSVHQPLPGLTAASRDVLSTPEGEILLLIFEQLTVFDDSTTTTVQISPSPPTPSAAAAATAVASTTIRVASAASSGANGKDSKSVSAAAAAAATAAPPRRPPRVLNWSAFENCLLVCKRWHNVLSTRPRFFWKRRALVVLRACEPAHFDRYFRPLQRPPPTIHQYDPDDDHEYSRQLKAQIEHSRERRVGAARRELQAIEASTRGVEDAFCTRLGQFQFPPPVPVTYVGMLFTRAYTEIISGSQSASHHAQSPPGLFRDVLFTKMRGQHTDLKCDDTTQRRIERFITNHLSAEHEVLTTAHEPYARLPFGCGYQRLGACIGLSVLNAGQSRRIIRLFRVVQSQFGVTRGWLQEVLCLLLCRIQRLWSLTLALSESLPEPAEELQSLYRIIRGAAYQFDVYENDIFTDLTKFPPPPSATAAAVASHTGCGPCTCDANELRKQFLFASKFIQHYAQQRHVVKTLLPLLPYHPRIRLSPEQEAVVRSDLILATDILYVPSFAGTGKTTTMLHYALARPHVSFLYVSFNKSMVSDVKRQYAKWCSERYKIAPEADGVLASADSDDALLSQSSGGDSKTRTKEINRVHNVSFRTLSSIYFAWLKQRYEKDNSLTPLASKLAAAAPAHKYGSKFASSQGRGRGGRLIRPIEDDDPPAAASSSDNKSSRELAPSDVPKLLPELAKEVEQRFEGKDNKSVRAKVYSGVLKTMNKYVNSRDVGWAGVTPSYFYTKEDPFTDYVGWAKKLFEILKTSDRAQSIIGKLLQLTGSNSSAAAKQRSKPATAGAAPSSSSSSARTSSSDPDASVQFVDFIAGSDKYDVLIVDEAQDLNGCDWDLVLRQRVPKLVIGDPHQSIYGFRGAVGIPQPPIFVPTKTLYLRQTFRFGAEIANLSHAILQLNGERQRLLGSSLPSKRGFLCRLGVPLAANGTTLSASAIAAASRAARGITLPPFPLPLSSGASSDSSSGSAIDLKLPTVLPSSDQFVGYTVLARTKKGLFDAALREAALGKPLQFNVSKFAAAADVDMDSAAKNTGGLNFALIRDAYTLLRGESLPASHVWVRKEHITTFEELSGFAAATNDTTLSMIVDVVKERKDETPKLLESIKSRIAVGAGLPPERVVTLSTVHCSKGMDWLAVRLEDDFSVEVDAEEGTITRGKAEDINLLYVAVTRAKRLLHPNRVLRTLFPSLLILRPLTAVCDTSPTADWRLQCTNCQRTDDPNRSFSIAGAGSQSLVCRDSTHPADTKHDSAIMTLPLGADCATAPAASPNASASAMDVDSGSCFLSLGALSNLPVVHASFPAAPTPLCVCSVCGRHSLHVTRLLSPSAPSPSTNPPN